MYSNSLCVPIPIVSPWTAQIDVLLSIALPDRRYLLSTDSLSLFLSLFLSLTLLSLFFSLSLFISLFPLTEDSKSSYPRWRITFVIHLEGHSGSAVTQNRNTWAVCSLVENYFNGSTLKFGSLLFHSFFSLSLSLSLDHDLYLDHYLPLIDFL